MRKVYGRSISYSDNQTDYVGFENEAYTAATMGNLFRSTRDLAKNTLCIMKGVIFMTETDRKIKALGYEVRVCDLT